MTYLNLAEDLICSITFLIYIFLHSNYFQLLIGKHISIFLISTLVVFLKLLAPAEDFVIWLRLFLHFGHKSDYQLVLIFCIAVLATQGLLNCLLFKCFPPLNHIY